MHRKTENGKIVGAATSFANYCSLRYGTCVVCLTLSCVIGQLLTQAAADSLAGQSADSGPQLAPYR
jgi:hypothetical protein